LYSAVNNQKPTCAFLIGIALVYSCTCYTRCRYRYV